MSASRRDLGTVVLGAGLAGAATAYALAKRGAARGLLVLEQERAPGTHATAQNAAMVRSILDEDVLADWGIAGTRWWNALPAELEGPGMFRRTGSLLLGEDDATLRRFDARAQRARDAGLDARIYAASEARERWGHLEDVPFTQALHVREDGVADPVALCARMLGYAEAHGAEIRYGHAAGGLLREVEGDRPVRGLRLRHGTRISCSRVVVASGAWAPSFLSGAAVDPRQVQPWRRHLALFGEHDAAPLDPSSPFVWHVDRAAYFRPESGGILVSVCDTDRSDPCRPEIAPQIDDLLYRRLAEVFPMLLDLPIRQRWAGLRTYRPSHEFVLGAAAEVPGLYFACGLGGHGVTCAGPVGDAVAGMLLERDRGARPSLRVSR